MTAQERLDHLVKLAIEAWDRNSAIYGGDMPNRREDFAIHVRERLAQGVQAWALDAEADVSEVRREALREASGYAESEARGRWRGNQGAVLAVAEGILGLR